MSSEFLAARDLLWKPSSYREAKANFDWPRPGQLELEVRDKSTRADDEYFESDFLEELNASGK